MERRELIEKLYESLGEECITSPDIAHIEIHANRVLGVHTVEGLEVEAREREDGIEAEVVVREGVKISEPVRICFGLLPETGVQHIVMSTRLEPGARVAMLASCTFPNAIDVTHSMDAELEVGEGAEYVYLERHVHSDEGGIRVIPKSRIVLRPGARFRTDFELIRGRVGTFDMEYDARCDARSVLEMSARIAGRGDDRIKIHEKAQLVGEGARGVLTTSIAVADQAEAEVRNTLLASAPFARGHVDCKEIVRDRAIATAIPIVDVRHPQAHVTHEAAIGAVDAKQLETLMSRGLTEDEATDLIIEGLLAPAY